MLGVEVGVDDIWVCACLEVIRVEPFTRKAKDGIMRAEVLDKFDDPWVSLQSKAYGK